MSRGMTLLEVLLSLALLGGIALACASWVGTAARGTEGTAERLRWRAAADSVLGLMSELIASGDFNPNEQRLPEQPRVRVDANALRIDTRFDRRAVTAVVELKDDRLMLLANGERLLLADVAEFKAEIDEESQVLAIAIRSNTGDDRTRSYVLP